MRLSLLLFVSVVLHHHKSFSFTIKAPASPLTRHATSSLTTAATAPDVEAFSYGPTLAEALRRVEARLGPLEPYAIPKDLRSATSRQVSKDGVVSRTEVVGFSVGPLRQIRAAVIEPARVVPPADAAAAAAAADAPLPTFPRVLNLVAFPQPGFRLPVFGADLVTLPGGHLVAIDLHPMLPPGEHRADVLPRVQDIYARYQRRPAGETAAGDQQGLLPWGGDLPDEAQPFFSPCAVWTRLPLTGEGRATLARRVCGHGDEREAGGGDGVLFEYLDAFLDLAAESWEARGLGGGGGGGGSDYSDAQRAYSAYRAEKDPARGMLSRMHGAEWTERLIHECLFDFAVSVSSEHP